MTQSFDEWFDTTTYRGYVDENDMESAWDAGAQSKQAEIDELHSANVNLLKSNQEIQVKIDEIENHVEMNYDCERDDDQHSYWSGYNQAMKELSKILKGEKN